MQKFNLVSFFIILQICNGSDITEFFSNLDEQDIYSGEADLWFAIISDLFKFFFYFHLLS